MQTLEAQEAAMINMFTGQINELTPKGWVSCDGAGVDGFGGGARGKGGCFDGASDAVLATGWAVVVIDDVGFPSVDVISDFKLSWDAKLGVSWIICLDAHFHQR